MRILLYSGGLDSLIAWYYLEKPQRLYVGLGTRYSQSEIGTMLKYSPEPQTIGLINHISWGKYEREDAWLPMRNVLLCMLAAAEGANKIYLVAQKGEQSIPDRSPEFFEDMKRFLSFHNQRDIEVDPVFPHMTKVEMVRWYLDQGLSPVYLWNAYSCYDEVGPCGQCSACWRKFIALTCNGIRYESAFKSDIRVWGTKHYLPKLEEYGEERQREMKEVMFW